MKGNQKKHTRIPRLAEYLRWYNRERTVQLPHISFGRRLSKRRKLCVV
jgi:hypothetical protein